MKKKKSKKSAARSLPKKSGFECYHCGRWILEKEKKSRDCWTTTEEALTQNLPDELLDAWRKIREIAPEFGEQRIYASHRSIMFARKNCYFFVRPTPKRLELVFFLSRPIKHPAIKKVQPTSKTKVSHMVHLIHEDQVEAPLTEWLKEAYDNAKP